jgi:glycine/D-amino acid oxidase-like deaminating enzyme
VPLPPRATTPWLSAARPSRPPLRAKVEADVAVVGAGIVGLTTAVLLARAGRSVVVLEARQVGAGTSGRTTAKVSALQWLRYRTIEQHHGAAVARRYAEAQLASLEWMIVQAGRAPDATLERARAVTYATSERGALAVAEELDAATRAGLAVERVDPELPFPTKAAIGLEHQAQFDPAAYLAALADELDRTPGATLYEGTRVRSVRGLRHHEVQTDEGQVHAQHVVIATLLPIVDRGLHFARAHPVSSYLVALRATGPLPPGMFISADQPTRSLRTGTDERGPILIVGGEGHDTGRGAPTVARYERLAGWAAAHFSVGEVTARWSAHDYEPVDALPWVGPCSPATPNVLMAAGFQKWGMTMGTAAALVLADRATGQAEGPSSHWSAAFDPGRATPQSLLRTAKLNAIVAGRLAAGWGRRAAPGAPPARTCTHLGGVCSWNDGDRTWDCPLHGSRFEADGSVLTGPATSPVTPCPTSQVGATGSSATEPDGRSRLR